MANDSAARREEGAAGEATSRTGYIPATPIRETKTYKVAHFIARAALWLIWAKREITGPISALSVLLLGPTLLRSAPTAAKLVVAIVLPALVWAVMRVHNALMRRAKTSLSVRASRLRAGAGVIVALWLSLSALITVPLGVLLVPGVIWSVAYWVHIARRPRPVAEPENAPEQDAAGAGETSEAAPQDEEPEVDEVAAFLASQAVRWSKKLAGTGGKLPDSLLTDMAQILDRDGNPNGFEGVIRLNQGDTAVKHTLADVAGNVKFIAAGYDTELGNVVVGTVQGARTVNAAQLRVFDRNPLEQIAYWNGLTPGSWTFDLAMTTSGQVVPYTIHTDGRPGHLLVVGTTGSGKSATLRLLIEALLRITTPEGEALTRVILCDPHAGMSFGEEDGNQCERVAHFASTTEEIFAAAAWLKEEIDRRVKLAKKLGQNPLRVTPENPLIAAIFDEWPKLWSEDPRLIKLMKHLVREARKVNVIIIVGSQGALLEDIGEQSIRDGLLAGGALLMRSMSAYTQLATSLDRAVGNPTQLPKAWPDGASAAGVLFLLLDGVDALSMSRVLAVDIEWIAANPTEPQEKLDIAEIAAAGAAQDAAERTAPGVSPLVMPMPVSAVTVPAPRPAPVAAPTPAEQDAMQVASFVKYLAQPANLQNVATVLGGDEERARAAIAAAAPLGVIPVGGDPETWVYQDPAAAAVPVDAAPADAAPAAGQVRARIRQVLLEARAPIRSGEVAERAGLKGPNTTQHLRVLETAGLAKNPEHGWWVATEYEHVPVPAADLAQV